MESSQGESIPKQPYNKVNIWFFNFLFILICLDFFFVAKFTSRLDRASAETYQLKMDFSNPALASASTSYLQETRYGENDFECKYRICL